MQPFRQYYADEQQFLSEMGREFAAAYPETARELGLQARDPDVERLLQGVAFLCARVRQSLDAEFPELLYPLLSQLWPHALRPTPAVVMVEFRPQEGTLREVGLLKAGALLQTQPIDGTPCCFRTAYPLSLFPARIEAVRTEAPAAGRALLRLTLSAFKGASVTRLGFLGDEKQQQWVPLRLHVFGTVARAHALHHWLGSQLRGVRLRVLGPTGAVQAERTLPAESVRPVGWGADEALLPYPPGSFAGYRHLHEYFLFPGKHLFYDVHGLECLAGLPPAGRLEICFELDPPAGDLPQVAPENLRLHCVPAVNLFPGSARPLRVDGTQAEYTLRPEGDNPGHHDIFAVTRVQAHVRRRGRSQDIAPFYSFQRPHTAPGIRPVLYQLHLRAPVCQPADEEGGTEARTTYPAVETALSFVAPGGGAADLRADLQSDLPPEQRTDSVDVSVDVLLTNRDLPRTGKLRPGDPWVETTDVPAGVPYTSLGPVSVSAPAPIGADGLWRFAGHLLLSWDHLRDRDALCELLRLYHFPARHHRGAEQKLNTLCKAIAGVSAVPERRVLGRPPAVLYGTHVTVSVYDTRFEHPGELFLFGTALHRFLAETATANTFTRLTVRGLDQGGEIAFAPRLGEQDLV